MKVIVVGCGPAGLAAAHAATGLGAQVRIISPKRMTPQYGPLLIQRPIPGINTDHPDGTIHQRVIGGSILDYRFRVYGDVNININGDILAPEYHAWNHRETYDRLWKLYHDMIEDRLVSQRELSRLHLEADLVVSTANARTLCKDTHNFGNIQVAITTGAMYPKQPDNTIIFNGGRRFPWTRSSHIFGHEVTEWSLEDMPPGARIIRKPISTDCVCYPKVLRTGRFGKWRNETWVDTAYWDTYTAIASMNRREELEKIR